MQKEQLIKKLIEVGANKIDTRPDHGFPMRVHDTKPDAPLSPIYLNLRTRDNPKPGPLTQELVDAIGQVLWETAEEHALHFDGMCGIPNAGMPLARAFQAASHGAGFPYPLLTLRKELHDGKANFSLEDNAGLDEINIEESRQNCVLIIDDVLTKADTKISAIQAFIDAGYDVLVLVFCEREQGGAEKLEAHGIKVVWAITVTQILSILLEQRLISQSDYDHVIAYLRESRGQF